MTREEAARILDGAEVMILSRDEKAFCKASIMAIEALRELDAKEKQKPMTEWISAKDRLPEPGKIVLVHQVYSWEQFEDGAAVTVGRLRPTENGRVSYWEFQYYRPDFRDGTVLDDGIICPGSEYITHWMPHGLPQGMPQGMPRGMLHWNTKLKC